MSAFDILRHLLPRGRPWRLMTDSNLRRWLTGLSTVGDDARDEIDAAWSNVMPSTTDRLSEWEAQWAIPASGLSESARRSRLDAAWKRTGGQSPGYIQDRLREFGFDVYVHESFEPVSPTRSGGSVNGDVTPIYRNPAAILGGGLVYTAIDGGPSAIDGVMTEGASAGEGRYPLVNKVIAAEVTNLGDGAAGMQDGGATAQDGAIITVYNRKKYEIPAGEEYWPHFIYIGGESFPGLANVPAERREEFEDLCLKICPCEKWLGILVLYT